MPLLLLFMPARVAAPFCILMGLSITLQLGIELKSHIDLKKIGPLLLGCLPGIACGTIILKHAENTLIKEALGLLLVGYSLFQLRVHLKPTRLHPSWGVAAGFLTGLIGAAFSAGGPPSIIYATLNDWDKNAVKATLTGFFFLTGIIIAIAHALAGITSMLVLKYLAAAIPFVIVGTFTGSRIYQGLSHRDYIRLIYVLLLAMGVMLIISGAG